MPSISSILSSLAGTLGISRNTREGNAPGNNASKRSEAVTDVVHLSDRALQAAKQATPETTRQRATRQDTDRAIRAHEQTHIATARTPEESIAKAQTLRAATTPAPATPSPQDRVVASEAARPEATTRHEPTRRESSPMPTGKPDNPKTHHGLAAYQETSNIFDHLKSPPSIRISV